MLLKGREAMRFTAETRGCLKCKISSLLTRNGGRTYGRTLYGRFSQNQNFWDAWNTMGAIHSTKIQTGPTEKRGPPQKDFFRLDRTDPLSFGPKFPESLVEWIAPYFLPFVLRERASCARELRYYFAQGVLGHFPLPHSISV